MENSDIVVEKSVNKEVGTSNTFDDLGEYSCTLNSSAEQKEKSCSVKSSTEMKLNVSAVKLSTNLDEEPRDLNSSVQVNEESSVLNTSTELSEETTFPNIFDEQILNNGIELITLEDELREIFSKCSRNFNVLHINAQSIPAHYLSMLATFVNLHNIDAILVSESFLKPKIESKLVDLPDYNLIRTDREDTGCGGVAIYLRKRFTFKIVAQSSSGYTMTAEYLFIKVFHQETKVLLGVFYSPSSKIEYFPTLEMLLIKYRSQYKHVNILGDFNTDLLKKGTRLKKLLSIIDHQNLRILPLGPTHFAPHSVESLLDLIIVSNSDEVVKHGQIDGYFSYHDMIYLSCNIECWIERETPSNNVASLQSSEIQSFWQKEIIRKALHQQLYALRKYKGSSRSENDVKEYQISKKPIQLLEKEFKRISRKTLKNQEK